MDSGKHKTRRVDKFFGAPSTHVGLIRSTSPTDCVCTFFFCAIITNKIGNICRQSKCVGNKISRQLSVSELVCACSMYGNVKYDGIKSVASMYPFHH